MTDQSQIELKRAADGLRLMRAFLRIEAPEQRRSVIELVERMARYSQDNRANSSAVESQEI